MQIGMCQISAEAVGWFRAACNSGELSRTALAHELCVKENWSGRVGRLCLASARKLLPRLAEELDVRLPEVEALEFAPHARMRSDFPDSTVSCPLPELGLLSLDLVAASEDRRQWEATIERHHPEDSPPAGRAGPNQRRGRTAKLTPRCTPVDLCRPKDRKGEPPIRMIAVSALEEKPL